MRVILAVLALTVGTTALAKPSSQVAWTPETLKAVKQGHRQHGQELAATCSACHGEQGVSGQPETPSLAGQKATYLYKQLVDYANGDREHAVMNALAAGLGDQDRRDLAAWYAGLPTPANTSQSLLESKTARRLVVEGDQPRALAPCSVCHGQTGEGGEIDIPALAGQSESYLAATLRAYRDGNRDNDLYQRMRAIAAKLTNPEIDALARYYQQLN